MTPIHIYQNARRLICRKPFWSPPFDLNVIIIIIILSKFIVIIAEYRYRAGIENTQSVVYGTGFFTPFPACNITRCLHKAPSCVTLTSVPSMLALLMLAGRSHSLKNMYPLLGWTTMARGRFRFLSRVRLWSCILVLSTFSVPVTHHHSFHSIVLDAFRPNHAV